jgi:hypothetical protein
VANVQTIAATNSGGLTTSLAIDAGGGWAASGAGSCIVLQVSFKYTATNGNPISSISDSATQTWPAPVFTGLQNAANSIELRVYVFPNSASLSTITVNFGANTYCTIIASEESGIASASAVDQSNTGNQATVSSWTTGNITTVVANDVCYGYDCNPSNSSYTLTPTGSWTALSGTGLTSGMVAQTGLGYRTVGMRQVLSGTATLAATGTSSGTTDALSAIIALKPASGGTAYTAWGLRA